MKTKLNPQAVLARPKNAELKRLIQAGDLEGALAWCDRNGIPRSLARDALASISSPSITSPSVQPVPPGSEIHF